jgi:CheY-like chemotaxis protein
VCWVLFAGPCLPLSFTLPYRPVEASCLHQLDRTMMYPPFRHLISVSLHPAPVSPPQTPDDEKILHNIRDPAAPTVKDNVMSHDQHHSGSHKHDRSKFHILVAEDDPVSRKMVSRMLQRSGYDILLASDGEEAVSMFLSHKDDVRLILMDVQMPKLSGHEATQQIRNWEKQNKTKQNKTNHQSTLSASTKHTVFLCRFQL